MSNWLGIDVGEYASPELCAQMNSLAKAVMFEGLYTIGLIDEELSLTFAGQALPVLKSAIDIPAAPEMSI